MKNENRNVAKYRYLVTILFVNVGILFINLSMFQVDLLTALIGLCLIIWGPLFFFITSTKMVRADLITPHLSSLTLALSRTLRVVGYEGETFILPPRVPGEQPVHIIKNASTNSKISIIPTGLDLESKFEENVGVSFFGMDLSMLEDLLVKVIVENLEIASSLKISSFDDKIMVKMTKLVFYDNMQSTIEDKHSVLYYPIVSALACAFAKSTQKIISTRDIVFEKGVTVITFGVSTLTGI